MVNRSDLMDQNIKTKNPKTPYIQYKNTEEWLIIEYLLNELENNQDIELKTAPEYVVGYLVEKLRNKDLLVGKRQLKTISERANGNVSLQMSGRSRR